jgi:hypothetical protein
MKNNLRKTLMTFAAASLTALTICGTASQTVHATDHTITPATISSIKIEQYLVLNSTASVPATTFSYKIEGGTAVAGTSTTHAVYSGTDTSKVTGTPTMGSAAFTVNQTKYTTTTGNEAAIGVAGSTYTNYVPVTLGEGKSYAMSDINIDFSKVTFNEPGYYRYVITETGGTEIPGTRDASYTFSLDKPKYLDVIVESNTKDDTLKVAQYILRTNVDDADTAKTSGFVNTYKTVNLTIYMDVYGNQSRTDTDFEVKLLFDSLQDGMKFTVSTNSTNGSTPVSPIVIGTNTYKNSSGDTVTPVTIYLKANEYYTIYDLPAVYYMNITEDAAKLKDLGYKAETKRSKTNVNGYISLDSTSNNYYAGFYVGSTADSTFGILNTKTGIIPTGIIITVAPYAAIALVGFLGIIVFAKHKKTKEEDE